MPESHLSIVSELNRLPKDKHDSAIGKSITHLTHKRSEQELWESFIKGDDSAFDLLY